MPAKLGHLGLVGVHVVAHLAQTRRVQAARAFLHTRTTYSVNSALHPSGVAQSSTSFGWVKGGNVTSAGWQVTLCDPMWHASSRSGVATLRTAIHVVYKLPERSSTRTHTPTTTFSDMRAHVGRRVLQRDKLDRPRSAKLTIPPSSDARPLVHHSNRQALSTAQFRRAGRSATADTCLARRATSFAHAQCRN